MATIYLKGIRDPIQIPDDKYEEAYEKWSECCATKEHEPMRIGNKSVLTSDIKGIEKEDDRATVNDANFDKTLEKVRENRRYMLSLSPKERAEENFTHFILALQVFCKKNKEDVNEAQKRYVLEKMEVFFENNPGWIVPSMAVYRNVFEKIGYREDENIFIAGALRFLEKVEATETLHNAQDVVLSGKSQSRLAEEGTSESPESP